MVSEKFKKSLLINGVLLVTDLGAGLILYNYGKSKGKKVSFSIPPGMELKSMLLVAGVTSILTGAALTKLENHLKVEIFDETDQAFMDVDEWESLFNAFKGLKIGGGTDGKSPSSIQTFIEGNKKKGEH
jgi:hypothetical protein